MMFVRALSGTVCSIFCFSIIGPFVGGLVFAVFMIPVEGTKSLLLPLAFFLFFPGAYAIGIIPAALSGLMFGLFRVYGALRFSRLCSTSSKYIYSRDWVLGLISSAGSMTMLVIYFAFLHDRGKGITEELIFLLAVGLTAGIVTGLLSGRVVSMIIPPNKAMHATSA